MPLHLTKKVVVQTPAKINFYLYIQGKRADGYHDLLLDLVPVSLYDTIEFQTSNTDQLKLSTHLGNLPQEENLVVKAVRLLEAHLNESFYLNIRLIKRIPSGAGLGGGSGNAAGTLVTLNKVLGLDLCQDDLLKMAMKLGADVPFFVRPRPSIAIFTCSAANEISAAPARRGSTARTGPYPRSSLTSV